MTMIINGSGTITGLSAGGLPDASVQTADIVDANITQAKLAANVAGTGPAFSAVRSGSNQSISSSTWTKTQYQTEEFDTNSCYDNATNYRFTPTVAGYYQFSWGGQLNTAGSYQFSLYKNGSTFKTGNTFSSTPIGNTSSSSTLMYMNGSTDYVELYAYSSVSASISADAATSYFQGVLVRAA